MIVRSCELKFIFNSLVASWYENRVRFYLLQFIYIMCLWRYIYCCCFVVATRLCFCLVLFCLWAGALDSYGWKE